MVCNTKYGTNFTSGKKQGILLLLEIEKKECKTLKTFRKLLKKSSQSPQYNQSRETKSSRGNTYEETDQELDISGNIGTIPKI